MLGEFWFDPIVKTVLELAVLTIRPHSFVSINARVGLGSGFGIR